MSISQVCQSWDREYPSGFTRAVCTLTFEASTKRDAEFLARLAACIRRGRPDADELIALGLSLSESKKGA